MDKLRQIIFFTVLFLTLCSPAFAEMQTVLPTPSGAQSVISLPELPVFVPFFPNYRVNSQPIQIEIVSDDTKNSFDWIVGIVIPLFSAFIGGFLALKCTRLTIDNQKQKDAEARRLSIKPWLYSNMTSQSGSCYEKTFYMMPPNPISNSSRYYFYIRNSDNGLCIIDKVVADESVYHLRTGGNVVGKNEDFSLCILLDNEKYARGFYNLRLYVKDVDGNSYEYPLLINPTIHSADQDSRTIGACKDL